jgi:hypothetical protein
MWLRRLCMSRLTIFFTFHSEGFSRRRLFTRTKRTEHLLVYPQYFGLSSHWTSSKLTSVVRRFLPKNIGCYCNCAHKHDCVCYSACYSECAYPNKYVYMAGGGGVGKSCLTVRMLQNTYMVCFPLNMTQKTGRKIQG